MIVHVLCRGLILGPGHRPARARRPRCIIAGDTCSGVMLMFWYFYSRPGRAGHPVPDWLHHMWYRIGEAGLGGPNGTLVHRAGAAGRPTSLPSLQAAFSYVQSGWASYVYAVSDGQGKNRL